MVILIIVTKPNRYKLRTLKIGFAQYSKKKQIVFILIKWSDFNAFGVIRRKILISRPRLLSIVQLGHESVQFKSKTADIFCFGQILTKSPLLTILTVLAWCRFAGLIDFTYQKLNTIIINDSLKIYRIFDEYGIDPKPILLKLGKWG